MEEKENLNFNFAQPVKEAESLKQFLEEKENAVKASLSSENKIKKGSRAWILVFVLMISLISLATYTLLKNRENERQIAVLKSQTTTTTPEGQSKNIVTADNFSLILPTTTPDNFALERKNISFTFLDNKNGVQVNFTGKNTKAGQELVSGIDIQISEFDNKMDKTTFVQQVLAKLGDKYELKLGDVTLPKDIKVSKIQPKDGTQDQIYYVTVTEDNYYVIKVYNQAQRYAEFENVSKFTESLLPSLYLN